MKEISHHPAHHQHEIDWWEVRGYDVTALTDWSLLCVDRAMLAQTRDMDGLRAAIRQRLGARTR